MPESKSTMVDLLESLADVPVEERVLTDKEKAELEYRKRLAAMSVEELNAKAFEWKLKGMSVQSIAQAMDVSIATVYRRLAEYREACRQRLEQEPAANMVAEAIEFYDHIETVCLYEIEAAKSEEATIDPKTGKVERTANNNHLSKVKYVQAALKARELKIQLLTTTGIIPKEPDKIYHKMEESKRIEGDTKGRAERSPDEVQNAILKLIASGRSV